MLKFWLGLFAGVGFAAVILLPLVYGVPRAIFDAIRRRAVWWAPFRYLLPPVAWFIALVVVGYLSAEHAPSVLRLVTDGGFVFGEWIGIGLTLFRCLTPTGRREMGADYLRTGILARDILKSRKTEESKSTLVGKDDSSAPSAIDRGQLVQIVLCPDCGYRNDSREWYCEYCGGELAEAKPGAEMASLADRSNSPGPEGRRRGAEVQLAGCPECGGPVESGEHYCARCGADITEEAQRSAARGPQRCADCSFLNYSGASYCQNCGVHLQTAKERAATAANAAYEARSLTPKVVAVERGNPSLTQDAVERLANILGVPAEDLQDEPLGRLDSRNARHLEFALTAVADYGNVLDHKGGKWARCIYYPESLLPYPKTYLREALEMLLAVANGERPAAPGYSMTDIAEHKDSLESGLAFLDSFLDAPSGQVPTDPHENAAFGARFRASGTR